MHLNINLVNLLIISGIVQGLIVCLILFFKKEDDRKAHLALVLALLTAFLHFSYLLLIDLNLPVNYPWLLWIPWNMTTSIGPLIYLYVLFKTDHSFVFRKQEIRLFLPVLAEIFLHFIIAFDAHSNEFMYYRSPFFVPAYMAIYVWAGGSVFIYLKKSLRHIHSHESWVLGNFSDLKGVTLKWLLSLIKYYRWIWLLWIPFVIILILSFEIDIEHFILVIILYTLIFLITYLSYFVGLEALVHSQNSKLILSKVAFQQTENTSYQKLGKEKVEQYVERITTSMSQEKLYLNDQISLSMLATQVDLEPNLVSHILNSHLNQSFYDFINSYRIDEAKKMMTDSQYSHFKIVAIAYACGFNSKSTFNRVFKKQVGCSPSVFLKSSIK